jgi:site-specific DNA recombinase
MPCTWTSWTGGLMPRSFFDRKAAEWRQEQVRLTQEVESHRNANRNYVNEGVKLLDLDRRAHLLFEKQPAREKRKLLDFVLSNCEWKNGELLAVYRQPFDLLAASVAAEHALVAAGTQKIAGNENWLPETYTDPNTVLENVWQHPFSRPLTMVADF